MTRLWTIENGFCNSPFQARHGGKSSSFIHQQHTKQSRKQHLSALSKEAVTLEQEGQSKLKGTPLSLQWRRKLAQESIALLQPLIRRSDPTQKVFDEQFDLLRRSCSRAEQRVRHIFRDKSLLQSVLIHPTSCLHSCINERAQQKLAWLGDALLCLFITEDLVQRYPNEIQRDWNAARRMLIDRSTLARALRALKLDTLVVVGLPCRIEYLGASTLGELYEAVLGAIYLDAGLLKAHKFYESHFSLPEQISQISNDASPFKAATKREASQKSARWHLKEAMLKTLSDMDAWDYMDTFGLNTEAIEAVQEATRVQFTDKRVWLTVLLHRSCLGQGTSRRLQDLNVISHQDKLCHLGDTIIMLAITDYILYKAGNRSQWSMTAMNNVRMELNSRKNLSRIARDLGLHDHTILGDCITKDHLKLTSKSLGDILSRLVGALYLDKGLIEASTYIIKLISVAEQESISR